jgi:hypothetical protein
MSACVFYIASKVKHAPKWIELRSLGVNIISSWIDEAGEGQTGNYRELSTRCLKEIRRCGALVLYFESGEILKGALLEAGAALALGKQVRAVGCDCPSISRVFIEHPLWITCNGLHEAFHA